MKKPAFLKRTSLKSFTDNYNHNKDNESHEKTSYKKKDFAQKGTLISTTELKKIALTSVSVIAFLIVVIAIVRIYKSFTTQDPHVKIEKHLVCQNNACIEIPGAGTNECKTNSDCIPDSATEAPSYAYIKDRTEIYTSTTDGKEKRKILTINDPDKIFTTIIWKDPNDITFGKCERSTARNSCTIDTLNLTTRSITPETSQTNSTKIRKVKFSTDSRYLAYIGQVWADVNGVDHKVPKLTFYLKAGSVIQKLKTLESTMAPSNTQNKILFADNNQYVIYSSVKTTFEQNKKTKTAEATDTPYIYVYQVNGVLIDEIQNARDPFLLDKDTLGFSKDGKLMYKDIGKTNETKITTFEKSYNPTISFDKKNIAYWKNEGGFSDVLLGIYNVDLGIHRNILRGVILPVWVTNNSVVGVKADGCIGQACLLYEYQTTSLVLVNINTGNVAIIDQGKSISDIDYLNETTNIN